VAFLKDKFGFTPAEARLVVHLVQGTSMKSSAEALGIKYETVRSYLKSAFLKTGTHRQAELVLKVFHAMSDPNPPAVPAQDQAHVFDETKAATP
jgi:DNA-binding CsgD family transcriptional regulator